MLPVIGCLYALGAVVCDDMFEDDLVLFPGALRLLFDLMWPAVALVVGFARLVLWVTVR